MNELTTQTKQLPNTLPELSKFVLIGREKLTAVRAEIRAIEKVGLAQEVRQQKLEEAQAISEAVLDAEVKIGELMAKVPKQNTHNRAKNRPDTAVASKTDVIHEAGFTPKQVERFQTIAKHPEAVEQAKAEARENDEVVTRSAVMKKIEGTKKPHVVNNSIDNEWYTPERYIESARFVMGSIDLDPASNDFANETVKASEYFTEETDGLLQEWFGNIWMNPPYQTALLQKFADKLVSSTFDQAIVLVNNATETAWFEKFVSKASAIVFHKGRIRFVKRDGEHGAPLQGQAFMYFGNHSDVFLKEFEKYGWGCKL